MDQGPPRAGIEIAHTCGALFSARHEVIAMAVILVVDDEEDACRLLERLLGHSGHTVRAFTEAAAARAWLVAHAPDLAILDLKLKDDDGLAFLAGIRREQPQTKVLVITGQPSADSARRALELGADDFLCKPLDIGDLEARVQQLLDREPGRDVNP
jgi:DNA-binding response OmpR family regulator